MLKKRLRDLLSEVLPTEKLTHIYNSYDIVGDIAIIRVTKKSQKYSRVVAEKIMDIHKNVETVLAQTTPVRGDFRLRKLEFVAGKNKTVTRHKEFGCIFSVDVEKCYFSSRLLYERMRIAKQVGNRETVVNMFAGVGCFSIIIAKHSKAEKIYSIDLNPAAFQFMQENVRLNKVYGKVVPIKGDAKEVIQKKLSRTADRIVMPLPEKALEYLPYALLALKNVGGWIHCYLFEHAKKAEDPKQKAKLKITEKIGSLDAVFQLPFTRIVRTTGPRWYQVAVDIQVFPRKNKRVHTKSGYGCHSLFCSR